MESRVSSADQARGVPDRIPARWGLIVRFYEITLYPSAYLGGAADYINAHAHQALAVNAVS